MALSNSVISFLCPSCRCVLRAAGPMTGRSSCCPICDGTVTVPAVSPAKAAEGPFGPTTLTRRTAHSPVADAQVGMAS